MRDYEKDYRNIVRASIIAGVIIVAGTVLEVIAIVRNYLPLYVFASGIIIVAITTLFAYMHQIESRQWHDLFDAYHDAKPKPKTMP